MSRRRNPKIPTWLIVGGAAAAALVLVSKQKPAAPVITQRTSPNVTAPSSTAMPGDSTFNVSGVWIPR